MIKRIRTFRDNECGAVTVDWVVLTALVVGLCGLVVVVLSDATGGLGSSVGTHLSEKTFD